MLFRVATRWYGLRSAATHLRNRRRRLQLVAIHEHNRQRCRLASHRFELRDPARITEVGGFFRRTNSGTATIFAAITRLDGPDDFPDSFDFSTADLVASTTLLVPNNSAGQDVTGSIGDVPLAPGWYALTFGRGRLGAPATGSAVASMVSLLNDLDPEQKPFVYDVVWPRFFNTNQSPSFFALGYVVPEPASLILIATTLAAWILTARHLSPSGTQPLSSPGR